jgi:integrase
LLLAELLKGKSVEEKIPLTLGELWRRYSLESSAHLDNAARTRRDAVTRASLLIGFWGADFKVETLCQNDVDSYTCARRAGGIAYGRRRVSAPVRARSPEADLVLLRSMIRWAMTVRTADGGRLLAFDPLFGTRRTREKNPKRPLASIERFQRTRAAMQMYASAAATDLERSRWLRMELALVLAEATGRRLGSIRQLKWEDVDFTKQLIRWRAEADKKRKEWVIPIPSHLSEEIRSFQRRLGVVGGWMFQAERALDQPMDRHLFDKWLGVAERAAGLPKLDGGLWHAYRRKWATERKHLPLKDVAAAGGWSDVDTLLKVYQQTDPHTLLAVMSEPRKVSEDLSAAR